MSKKHNNLVTPMVFAFSAAMLVGSALSAGNMGVVRINNTKENGIQRSFKSDYDSKQEALEAGLELNEKICEEGMVLLKNENETLPLRTVKSTAATRISLFGFATVRSDGGGGDRSDGSAGLVKMSSDIYSSLKDAGYVLNPVLESTYKGWAAEMKDGFGPYGNPMKVPAYNNDKDVVKVFNANKTNFEASYNDYNDAAVVMLKSGTNPLNNMRFDAEQDELLEYVTSKFDKVILLINNSKPVELMKYKNNPKIQSIVIVGNPGDNGFDAVGKILNGTVNPSGRLSDIYPADLTKDPSYNNYSASNKGTYNTYKIGKEDTDSYFVDYEEGIYVGYRYYETRGYEEVKNNPSSKWYEENVAYPFGAGLSYTSFEWTSVGPKPTSMPKPGEKITLSINVKNTGKVAGKDVVQCYITTPYTKGGIEKSHVVLTDFAKTKLLQPGEETVVKLSFDFNDFASYDYNDKNHNNFKGYELEKGNYTISLRRNSHDVDAEATFNLANDAKIEKSQSGTEVKNRFDDVNAYVDKWQKDLLSRENLGKATTAPTAEEISITAEEHKKRNTVVDQAYDTNKPWTAKEMPNYDKDPSKRTAKKAPVQLEQLIGKSYDDPLWDKLLDQLSIEEMQTLIENGGFGTMAIDYIGKPYVKDTDGPKGWTGNGVGGQMFNMFAAEPLIAATWNKELAYEMGVLIGNQGIWGNSDVTNYEAGDRIYGYTGWYAPAMNTHRSPFDIRYTEYYSEDGVLAGQIAANTSLGARSKGAYVFIKHFACHDDGGGVGFKMNPNSPLGFDFVGYRGGTTATSGLSVWANEQAMREVYFKPFQIAVEEGSGMAVMSAFNRLGTTWAGGSYALLTEILRQEWGFKGMVVTDISIYGFLNPDQMIRAGGDIILTGFGPTKLFTTDYTKALPATQVAQMRRATKNVLYATANSNAMQVPMGAKVFFNEAEYEDAELNKDYTANLGTAALNTASNYSEITYELGEGDLPDGLDMDATGKVTGKPTKAGTFHFTVEAKAAGYETAKKTYTINVKAPAKPVEDETAREDIGKLETELDSTKKDLDATKKENESLKGLATGGLVVGVLGLIAAVGSIVLNFFKRK